MKVRLVDSVSQNGSIHTTRVFALNCAPDFDGHGVEDASMKRIQKRLIARSAQVFQEHSSPGLYRCERKPRS